MISRWAALVALLARSVIVVPVAVDGVANANILSALESRYSSACVSLSLLL